MQTVVTVAYSTEQVLLNKKEIWCGGAYPDCYQDGEIEAWFGHTYSLNPIHTAAFNKQAHEQTEDIYDKYNI